jgi:DNA-binding NarL/FixJ family response regulator
LRHKQPVVGAPSAQSLVAGLSQRELAVLRLLDSALTGPEIARELYVTVNTLRTHSKRIFTKLDVRTRAAAVRRAHELGLLKSLPSRGSPSRTNHGPHSLPARPCGLCHSVVHIMW